MPLCSCPPARSCCQREVCMGAWFLQAVKQQQAAGGGARSSPAIPPLPCSPPGGVSRFYRGFSPCLMRAAPANAVMLFTVDKVGCHGMRCCCCYVAPACSSVARQPPWWPQPAPAAAGAAATDRAGL